MESTRSGERTSRNRFLFLFLFFLLLSVSFFFLSFFLSLEKKNGTKKRIEKQLGAIVFSFFFIGDSRT